MYKVYIKENYLFIEDSTTPDINKMNARKNIYIERDGTIFNFYREARDFLIITLQFSDIVKEDGNPYTDIDEFVTFIVENTGSDNTYIDGNFKVDVVEDYYMAISKGDIPGTSHINKFGANSDITKDTTEDVWDGGATYTFPKVADITHMHQDVDQPTLRGGKIELQGLDANWDAITQIALLDPTDTSNIVAIPTPMIRIFRMKVMEDVVSSSDIHVDNAGDTIHYAIMTAGNNQTLMAIYTVPRGKTAYLTHYYCTVIDATNKTPTSTVFKLWAADRFNGYEFQLKHAVGIPSRGNMTEHKFMPYGGAGQMTDIKITAHPADENANVASGFGLILIDD